MQQDEGKTQNKNSKKNAYLMMSWVLVVCLFIGVGLLGYVTFHRFKIQTNTHIATLLEKQKEQINALRSELREQKNFLKTALEPKASDTSFLMKARYALELAQMNAYWTLDYQTTMGLLKTADALLLNHTDPALFPIREAIAQEITEQDEAPKVDTVGLLSQLNAIEQQSRATKVPTKTRLTTPKTPIASAKSLLEHLIIIRHHEKPIQPLQSPTYQAMLQEAMFFNLQEAKWAVIQGNDSIYQLALTEALTHMHETSQDPTLIEQLSLLKNVSLNQPHVVPSQSLTLLNTLLSTPVGVTTP
ncbi:MAG: uroporphyrinogen-III C-methyltransferase [Legionellaceae bacterium]